MTPAFDRPRRRASPFCPVAHYDAIAWFKYLQENAPVHVDEEGRYVLTRYDDICAALQNEPDVWSSKHDLTIADHPLANERWLPHSDDVVVDIEQFG